MNNIKFFPFYISLLFILSCDNSKRLSYSYDCDICEDSCLQELYSEQIGYDNHGLDGIMGGYEQRSFIWETYINSEGNTGVINREIHVPNYANFCLDDIANCYTEDGELITQEGYDPSNIKWIDLPHDGLGENDEQWYDQDNPDYWNGGLVPCLAYDIGSNDPEKAGCNYQDPNTLVLPNEGDVRIIDFIHLTGLERWDIGEDNMWNTDDDELLQGLPIEDEFDCINLSSAGDIFFSGQKDYNPKWTSQGDGFCYAGKSTCSEIGGDYSCHYDLSYNSEYTIYDEGYGVFNPFGNVEFGLCGLFLITP